jgi:hypothetical protein
MGVGEGKIVIAGTGRAGTTLLIDVLTQLGLDTGFRAGAAIDTRARAGLERSIFAADAPRIVKNPGLSTKLRAILSHGEIAIDHVIVPMRDLDVAVASRVRVSDYGRDHGVRGGMVGGKRPRSQRTYLAELFYELMWTLVEFDVPHTLLAFPRFATDATYTYEKLAWLLTGSAIGEADLERVLAARTDASVINEAPLSEAELRKARLGTAYATTVALPFAKVRSWLRRGET